MAFTAPFWLIVNYSFLFLVISFLLLCSPYLFNSTASTSIVDIIVEVMDGQARRMTLIVRISRQGTLGDYYTFHKAAGLAHILEFFHLSFFKNGELWRLFHGGRRLVFV